MNKIKYISERMCQKALPGKKTNSVVGNAITRWGKRASATTVAGSRHREIMPPTQPRANYNLNRCKTKPFHKELAAKHGQSQKKFHRYSSIVPETLECE